MFIFYIWYSTKYTGQYIVTTFSKFRTGLVLNRGARRFSPRADCNIALRAWVDWEGAFGHAYLAKWPRIEGQLMPVVSVAPPDVYNRDILSISLHVRARRALSRGTSLFFPPFFFSFFFFLIATQVTRNKKHRFWCYKLRSKRARVARAPDLRGVHKN
jgi:hypothetical protein